MQVLNWKPISTAPTDGTEVLLYTHSGIVQGWFSYGEWEQGVIRSNYDMFGTSFEYEPTHWCELPENKFGE